MQRVHRDIARDAARVTRAPLVQVLVLREHDRPARTAAVDGVALASPGIRDAVGELLGHRPGAAPASPLLAPGGPARAMADCEPDLSRLLFPEEPGPFRSAFFRLGSEGKDTVVLRFVVAGPIHGEELRALDAVARLAAGRVEAEALGRELAGRSAAYRTFQESAGEAIFVVDPTTGRILEGNQKLCELTGWRRNELRRLSLARILDHPVLSPAALLGRLAAERVVRDDETRLRRRHGDPVPVAVTAARIELPDRPVLHVIARDVSRERRAVAELRQAKETLAAFHVAAAHLNVESDERAVYGVLTRELLRLGFQSAVLLPEPGGLPGALPVLRFAFTSVPAPLQRAMERQLGRPLGEIRVDPASAPLVRRVLEEKRTIHTDRSRRAALELLGDAPPGLIRKVGKMLALRRFILAPLRGGPGIAGILAVATSQLRRSDPEAIDAFALQASIALEKARLFAALHEERSRLETEVERRTRELRVAVQALQAADRRKDNFLANISHELRTPLVTVLGYAELLLAGKLGDLAPRQRDALAVVGTSGRRLKGFIDELLEFSRHELTRDAVSPASMDLRDAMTQAAMSLAPRFAERELRVRVRAPRRLPRVWADPERILQVLVNLLANAERYSPRGGAIRLAAAEVRGGRVEVAVTDHGPGIPDEHLDRIFDRLYQVRDAGGSGPPGGALGLGLAIVKAIVDAHGGAVSVRSRTGRGTTFRFSLPTVDAVGPEARADTVQQPGAATPR